MRMIMLFILRAYKLCVSPLLPGACRFTPSCSDYARDAVLAHGAFTGSLLAFKRLMRCHPWGQSGFDPIPTSCDCGASHEE